jgi:ornithine carbamoyltransferase
MANSWIEAASVLGFELRLACPGGYHPDEVIFNKAKASGSGKIEACRSVEEAATGADVLNTDVWASMGQEEQRGKRLKAFKGYQINEKVLAVADKGAIVMHCLPAHRGEEITDGVIEGPGSVVWEQAENRLHIQKAILEMLLA